MENKPQDFSSEIRISLQPVLMTLIGISAGLISAGALYLGGAAVRYQNVKCNSQKVESL